MIYDGNATIQLLKKRAKLINANIKKLKLKKPLVKILPPGIDPKAAFKTAFNIETFEDASNIDKSHHFFS